MLLSTSMLGVSFAPGSAAAQDSPRDAIELYFRAHAFGDGDYTRRAFADDAKIEFVENGQLKQWTREEFALRFHGPAPDEYRRVRRVESLDVRGTAASAVVTLDYPQVLFRDHLSLLKIPAYYREVLLLRFHEDLGLEEIATLMSTPVSTVKSRLYRGLAARGRPAVTAMSPLE